MEMLNTKKMLLVVLLAGSVAGNVFAAEEPAPAPEVKPWGQWAKDGAFKAKDGFANGLDGAADKVPYYGEWHKGVDEGYKKNIARAAVLSVIVSGTGLVCKGIVYTYNKISGYVTSKNAQEITEDVVVEMPVLAPAPVVTPVVNPEPVQQPEVKKSAPRKGNRRVAHRRTARPVRRAAR